MIDGGPAFPQPAGAFELERVKDGNVSSLLAGMSLRDYFAAKAMAQLITLEATSGAGRYDIIPEGAYAMADAMLVQREK